MLHRGLGLVSRRMRWAEESIGNGWGEKKQIVMKEKPEGKGPLRTPLLRIGTSGMLL
jgi:hypothetical protein